MLKMTSYGYKYQNRLRREVMKSMSFAILKGSMTMFLPGSVWSGSALSRGERL